MKLLGSGISEGLYSGLEDPNGDTFGDGPWPGLALAETERGAGEDDLDPGEDVDGESVYVVLDKSGCDTELVQTRFDILDNRLPWLFAALLTIGPLDRTY